MTLRMFNPDYYKELPARLRREALNKLITSEITPGQFTSEIKQIDLMQMSNEELQSLAYWVKEIEWTDENC